MTRTDDLLRVAFAAVIAVCCPMFAVAASPELQVPRVSQPPVVDGRLNDACWKVAPAVTEFRCVDKDRALATQRTEAWVAFDDDSVYVAAKCYDDRMDQVQAVETGVDGSVWRDDCMEVFLMPGSPYYYHFAANLLGTRYDARHNTLPGKEEAKPESWNGDWRVGSQRSADHWSMEFAIPFACLELGAKRLGDPFRCNVGREQRRLTEFSCWPASQFNKHDEFAILKGLSLDAQRYGLTLRDVVMGERVPGPNQFHATVAEESTPNSAITLRGRVRPLPQGEPKTYTVRTTTTANAILNLTYNVPLTGGLVEIVVETLDEKDKLRISLSQSFRVPSALEGVLDLPLLYRSDGVVRLSGRVAVPATLLAKAKLQVGMTAEGQSVLNRSVPIATDTGKFQIALPVGRLRPGSYAVETRLTVADLTSEPVVNRFPFRLIAGPLD